MDEQIHRALAQDRTIDITTVGRTSGRQHRIETWYYRVDGQIYLTGLPGQRDWYANLLATPSFTFHLKESVKADLAARAAPTTEPEARRAILSRILDELGRSSELEAWVAESPLVAVRFVDTGQRS